MIIKIKLDKKTQAIRAKRKKKFGDYKIGDNPSFDFLIYVTGLEYIESSIDNSEAWELLEKYHREAREKIKKEQNKK